MADGDVECEDEEGQGHEYPHLQAGQEGLNREGGRDDPAVDLLGSQGGQRRDSHERRRSGQQHLDTSSARKRKCRSATARSGGSHDADVVRGLIDRGWFAAAWPEALGGPGLDSTSVTVIGEELNHAPTR